MIKDEELKVFIESDINTSFNLSINTIAKNVKNYGRFKHWLNSDINRIKKILEIVKNEGVSPAFFAGYEVTEGYNQKWGWLNHTVIKGSPEEDAKITARWIVQQSKKTTDNPAWIDYANFKDFVPEDVKEYGNNHFKSIPIGSIGRVVIAGTSASTWEVYYPEGLLKEYNGVQNYGKPLTKMKNLIKEWGGDLEGNEEEPEDIEVPDIPDTPDIPDYGEEVIKDSINELTDKLLNSISNMLNIYVYDYGSSKKFSNSFIDVEKVYNNYYKIKPNLKFNEVIKSVINNGYEFINDVIDSTKDNESDKEPEVEETEESEEIKDDDLYFPVDYSRKGINFWFPPYIKGSVQEGMDFGGSRANGRIHAGYDIGGGGINNHKVYSIRSGKVIFIGNEGARGFVIKIKHNSDDIYSMYCHLKSNSQKVKLGQYVHAGEEIAIMGDTPNGMYAIHLHIEIDKTGEFKGYEHNINPREYLKVVGNNQTLLPNPAKK